MHLIVSLIFFVASFFIWYCTRKKLKKFHFEILMIMLGAASIMWMVDGFAGLFGAERKFLGIEPYVYENGAYRAATALEKQDFFYQGMNDLALGIAIVVAALVVYSVILIIIDPLNVWRKNKEIDTNKEDK